MAGDHLIVDLTGVTDIDEDVVDALVAKARTAGTKEKTLTFVRKQGSIVDQAIVAAETALS
ncbi:hypothetical protein ASE24_24990 [Nocardioides sp. Root224]|nr:hypothetical protein ASE24_24990 [Nocardioides sp. Root224]